MQKRYGFKKLASQDANKLSQGHLAEYKVNNKPSCIMQIVMDETVLHVS